MQPGLEDRGGMTMSLVHYYPGESFFHELDSRVKMIWLVCMFLLAFSFNSPIHLGVLLLLTLALWLRLHFPFSEMKMFLKALTMIAAITFLFQLLFYPGKHVVVSCPVPRWLPYFRGTLRVTLEGIVNGIAMILRLFTIVLTMPIMMMATPIEHVVMGLIKLGLPYEIAFAITTSLNLVPTLQSDARMIMDAQKARAFASFEKGGVREKLKAYTPLLVPLLVGSLKKGQRLEVAMESRAFGAFEERTYLKELKMRRSDYAFVALTIGLTAACIAARLSIGFGAFKL